MASFDENGKYIKTDWKAGDKITATKLNKIEESIEAVNDNDISRHVEADARLDALEAKDVAHDKELTDIKNTIADNKAAAELGDYDINSRMTFLENELNEGIEEVHNVAETVDGKIATAEANMTAQVNTAKDEMTAQMNTATANMTTQANAAKDEMNAAKDEMNTAKDEITTQVNTAKDEITTQVNTATANMTAQVNQGKTDMAAMVAEAEVELREAINKIGLLEVKIQELETEISKLVPVVGTVNEDNTITITYDMLDSGIYTLEYDFKDGTQEELEEFTVNEDPNQINLMEEAEIRLNSRYSKSGGGYIDVDGVISFTIPFVNDSGNAMRLEFDNLTYTMLTSDCILYILDNDKSNPSEVNGNTVISEMTSGVEVADDGLSGTITFTPPINEGYITISVRTKDDDTATTADEIKDYIAILTMEVTN